MNDTNVKTQTICELNDALRQKLTGGTIFMTPGVLNKKERAITQLMEKLCAFTDFADDNDPYKEHDFGQIIHDGQKYFWKIDYYDTQMQMHSPDPSDPSVTCRILTIMLAEEY